jgi:hypothetical protein
MGKRRRRLKPGGPRKQYTSTRQLRMLNLHHKTVFKYHLTRLLDDSEMREDHRQTFIANILSKASQASIDDAKDYINSVVDEGHLEEDRVREIFKLLDRYTIHR